MKTKVIHQWRDWLLEYVGVGKYSFIKKNNKTVVRIIVAKDDIDAEKQCQIIIKTAKTMAKNKSFGEC